MSYLGFPHIVFSGQFQADPSTVNNDPAHFDSLTFRSEYKLPGVNPNNWNPRGTGAWRFKGCTVQRVVYADGTSCEDPNVDPLVGTKVNDGNDRVEGKLVDLDPEQQLVTELWGFRLLVEGSGGFKSNFVPSPFADIWVRVPKGPPKNAFFGVFYQSTLEVDSWTDAQRSRLMRDLSVGGVQPKRLSIKFNVDGYNDDSGSPSFGFGRVVGAIGLYLPGEPHHFIAGRVLQPVGTPSPFNTAYAQLDGGWMSIDLGNSLPTQSPGGSPVDQERLWMAILPAAEPPVLLREIDYRIPNWYEQTAGIVCTRLTAAESQQAANSPLGVVQSGPQGIQPVLSEAPDGRFVRADAFVFRLNPGDTASTKFYATTFGNRATNQVISLAYDASIMQAQATQGPIPGPHVLGQPQSALTFPGSVTTGTDGTVTVTLQASDPGNPRTYIDGQLYGVTYGLGSTPPAPGVVHNPSQILSALVWSTYKAPDKPDWLADVRPVLQQYANLYPVMDPIVDMDNYASLMGKRLLLRTALDAPITDPNYMPVTRDLSNAKRMMLRKWLDRPQYMQLDSVEDVTLALQLAIELEHATIPPYLCALYSIKEGTNIEVAALMRSIVMEEMLHMALACNLLISIGGSPKISVPNFVPEYPGPLPGGLRGGLIVRLRRCSISHIRDVFMSIERPEEAIEPARQEANLDDPLDVNLFTIGWFYDEIVRSLDRLSQAGLISFGNVTRQVTTWFGRGSLFAIGTLEDAKRAIRQIKHQGEGCAPLGPSDDDRELAHYYKFAEIVAGRRLVASGDTFTYTGPTIPFDSDGIWPMMDDPNLVLYKRGSLAATLAEQFAWTYQALLKGLDRAFNGEPAYSSQIVGLMYSLSITARKLMQTPSGLSDGTTAGPSFQLPFTE